MRRERGPVRLQCFARPFTDPADESALPKGCLGGCEVCVSAWCSSLRLSAGRARDVGLGDSGLSGHFDVVGGIDACCGGDCDFDQKVSSESLASICGLSCTPLVFPFGAAGRRRGFDSIGEAFEQHVERLQQSVTCLCYSLISDAVNPHVRSVSNRRRGRWEANCVPLPRFEGPGIQLSGYPARFECRSRRRGLASRRGLATRRAEEGSSSQRRRRSTYPGPTGALCGSLRSFLQDALPVG
ncbi:MAG: hypothetical protein K0Q61_129 [Rhodococcus erythropolis]|nr:hypothetical protein [Rhodococcus erythropolis]